MLDENTLYLAPKRCESGNPSGGASLVDLYGLRSFANSVARQDPETGAKRKLRKSYKNHVADLPGKHTVPGQGESAWQLLDAAMRPPVASVADAHKLLDFNASALAKIKFQRGSSPLPGFDPKLLVAQGNNPEKEAHDASSPQVAPSPRGASPAADDHRKESKRKRKEGVPVDKRRKV